MNIFDSGTAVVAAASEYPMAASAAREFRALRKKPFSQIAVDFQKLVAPFALRKAVSEFPAKVRYDKRCMSICKNTTDHITWKRYEQIVRALGSVAGRFGTKSPSVVNTDLVLVFSAQSGGVTKYFFAWMCESAGRSGHKPAHQTFVML